MDVVPNDDDLVEVRKLMESFDGSGEYGISFVREQEHCELLSLPISSKSLAEFNSTSWFNRSESYSRVVMELCFGWWFRCVDDEFL